MKKIFPFFLIIIALSCYFFVPSFFPKYEDLIGFLGFFFMIAGVSSLIIQNNKQSPAIKSPENDSEKRIPKGWIVVIIFLIIVIFLGGLASQNDNHVSQWLFFFSLPLLFFIFIVNLITTSS